MRKQAKMKLVRVLPIALLVILIVFMNFSSAGTLNSGLVSYYKLDGTSGDVVDELGVNNGTTFGGVTRGVTGKINKSFDFDGINDYVNLGTTEKPVGNKDFSVGFWFNADSFSSDSRMVAFKTETNYHISFNGTGSLVGTMGGAANLFPIKTGISSGTWYYVTTTYDYSTNTMKSYVNGVLETTVNPTVLNVSDTIWFGSTNAGLYNYDGKLDEVGVWNKTLSSGEVSNLYNSGSGFSYPFVTNVSTILNSPLNGESWVNSPIQFQATGHSDSGYNLTNMTLQIWNSTGLFNETSINVSGTTNISQWNVSFTNAGEYTWNVLSCANKSGFTDDCSSDLNNRTFEFGLQVNWENHTSPILETTQDNFIINVTTPSTIEINNVQLYYNGTSYEGEIQNTGGSNYSINRTLNIPLVTVDTNLSFYWKFTYNDSSITNSSIYNQTVLNLQEISVQTSCSAGFFPAVTFDLQDENLTTILSDIEYNIKYGITNTSDFEVYGSFTNESSFSICVNETNNQLKFGDSQIKYGKTPHVEKQFFLFNDNTLSNTTTTNHTLYNLQAIDSTSFLVTVEDNALSPFQDKYVSLMRWYPEENEYKVVEMGRTDEDGQTVLKVVVEDVDYRLAVYEKDGALIKITDPLRMVCLVNPCELSIKVDDDIDFGSSFEVDTTLTYNETTQLFKLIWNDPNQLTDLMNLTVYKITSTSKIQICSSSSTSFTGVLTCSASGYTGTLLAEVRRTASPEMLIDDLLVDLRSRIFDSGGGGFGLFLSFLLVVFVALAAIINPIMAVIAGVIALIPALMFGAVTLPILLALISMGALVIHFLKKT